MSVEQEVYSLNFALGVASMAWDPFSRQEELWSACPGHEWVRFVWDKDRREPAADREALEIALAVESGRKPTRQTVRRRVEFVTRCRVCGAPRCDSYDGETVGELVAARSIGELPDAEAQFYRCTLERHHREPHDYLTGRRSEVGA